MNTPRAKMLHYMKSLKEQVGYVSLKTKYMERQARNFPSLLGFDTDIISRMDENLNGELEDIVPVNPIEEKDKHIAALEKKVETLIAKETKDLDQEKNSHQTSLKKLSFTQKATEQRLLDSISNPEGFHADPVLIGVFSATLDEQEVYCDDMENPNSGRSRKDNFLKSMEEKIDHTNADKKERFLLIKKQILEKVKTTQHSKIRSRSGSRSTSSKRELSLDSANLEQGKSPVRQKVTGIPVKK